MNHTHYPCHDSLLLNSLLFFLVIYILISPPPFLAVRNFILIVYIHVYTQRFPFVPLTDVLYIFCGLVYCQFFFIYFFFFRFFFIIIMLKMSISQVIIMNFCYILMYSFNCYMYAIICLFIDFFFQIKLFCIVLNIITLYCVIIHTFIMFMPCVIYICKYLKIIM